MELESFRFLDHLTSKGTSKCSCTIAKGSNSTDLRYERREEKCMARFVWIRVDRRIEGSESLGLRGQPLVRLWCRT
jgi:hypothetical protein